MIHLFPFTLLAFSVAGYKYVKTINSICDYPDQTWSLKWVWHAEGDNDITSWDRIISFDECQRLCDLDSDCRAFAHYDKTATDLTDDGSLCWLVYQEGPYERTRPGRRTSCNVKIRDTIPDPAPDLPTTFMGKGTCKSATEDPLTVYKWFEGGDKEACSAKCSRTEGCIGFSTKYDGEYHFENCILYEGEVKIGGATGDDEDSECYSVCRDDICNYDVMEGACVTSNGKRPVQYDWKEDQYTEEEPNIFGDLISFEECIAVCTENDMCIGFETNAEPNHPYDGSVCKIMIERKEYIGDPSVAHNRFTKCVQKKVFDKHLADFVKVGPGKCTAGGWVPKVLKVHGSKLDCKKQCALVDNCRAYNHHAPPHYEHENCYLWLETIDGSDETTEADYGTCRRKVQVYMREVVTASDASRHYIIVGGVGIGLVSVAAVFAWNFKKGVHREELETLI